MLSKIMRNGIKRTVVDYTEDEQRIFDATGEIWLTVAVAGSIGLFGLMLWSASEGLLTNPHPRTNGFHTFGIYLLVSCAALGAGALFGFLFGIPRTRAVESAALRDGDDPGAVRRAVLTANTNLERVSDWLTTLLLGATLVQLNKIVEWIGDLGATIRTNPDQTVTTVLVLYFVVIGFLGTYLVTRLYLTYALQRMLLGPEPMIVGLRSRLEDALRTGDKAQLDTALTAFDKVKSRPELGDDPSLNLLVARAASKRVNLGALDANAKTKLQNDLLAAWNKAVATPAVKAKAKEAQPEFQNLDDTVKTAVNKALE